MNTFNVLELDRNALTLTRYAWSPEKEDFFPLVLALAIGTVLIVWAADAFVDIAAALKVRDPRVQNVDATVHDWFHGHRTPFLSSFFIAITVFGGPVGMGGLVATTVAALLLRRRFRWAAYLSVTAAGGAALNQLLKAHFERQRPDLVVAVLEAPTGTPFRAAMRWPPRSSSLRSAISPPARCGRGGASPPLSPRS